jgi:hypothetical protein
VHLLWSHSLFRQRPQSQGLNESLQVKLSAKLFRLQAELTSISSNQSVSSNRSVNQAQFGVPWPLANHPIALKRTSQAESWHEYDRDKIPPNHPLRSLIEPTFQQGREVIQYLRHENGFLARHLSLAGKAAITYIAMRLRYCKPHIQRPSSADDPGHPTRLHRPASFHQSRLLC